MFQNAGEKGIPHLDPEDPPRRRGNKRPGHGTFENDRPPIVGTVGRESGEVRMDVTERTDQPTLEDHVEKTTQKGAAVNTDEWSGYARVENLGRVHKTVSHNPSNPEWARDDDGASVATLRRTASAHAWPFSKPRSGRRSPCIPLAMR